MCEDCEWCEEENCLEEPWSKKPMTPAQVLREAMDTFIEQTQNEASRDMKLHYHQKTIRLQNEIDIHIREKASLMESYQALQSYVTFLQEKVADALKQQNRQVIFVPKEDVERGVVHGQSSDPA